MNPTRRKFLASTATAPALALTGGAGLAQKPAKNPRIAEENSKQGTTDWQLTRVRVNEGKYRTSLIEGYVSHQSIKVGETLDFFVSTKPERDFKIDVYRLGYYGGMGGRHMTQLGPFSGKIQPVPEMKPKNRLRECKWKASTSLKIPADWVSGVYVGKLTTIPENDSEPYWQSYVIFVVRDDREADVIFQTSDNTAQAYNRWPENESLYTDPRGAHAPGVAVSFDRPHGLYCQIFENPLSVGSGEFLLWEFPLCYWLEKEGYDVTYTANVDMLEPGSIERGKVFLSVAHDEYWDARQYSRMESAIEGGLNVLWLCGNSVFIDSPFTASSSGQANRIITRRGCFGDLRQDETENYGHLFDVLKSTAPDERKIMGVRSVVPFNGGGDWTCRKADHWIFEGTGMKNGDSIPGLVGWEHHGEPDPDLEGLEILAEGKVWAGGVREGKYTSVIFPGPKENFVFNASTVFWNMGLSTPPGHWAPYSHYSRPHGPDERVQRITKNLLNRAIQSGE
ncbi:MAG: N,N-dimethylformamidase beta subunit family domain-containing protein [Verrucomicrobiales bacterium]